MATIYHAAINMSDPSLDCATSSNVLSLPDELLTGIANALPAITDVQNLRLAGSDKLARAGLDALHQRMSTIYIEQTTDSIERFRQICESPARACHIAEVVYVATLQKLTADEFREVNPLYLSENRLEGDQVVRTDVSKDIIDEVARIHEQRRAEQQTLLSERAVETALIEVFPRLPKLKKISFAGLPSVPCKWTKHGHAEEAYNVQMSWRWRNVGRGFEKKKHVSDREYQLNSTWWKAEYGPFRPHPFGCDNPSTVFRALAALNNGSSPRDIELDFFIVPISVLSDA